MAYRSIVRTLDIPPLGDNAEDRAGAVLVLEVAVEALPGAVVEETEPPREEEGVGPGLAAPRDPLALGGHGQERPRVEERGRARGGQAHLVARLATVDLKIKQEKETNPIL